MITESELFRYVATSYPYEQKDISIIDNLGRQIILEDFSQLLTMRQLPYTLKLESMEKYSQEVFSKTKEYAELYDHAGPVTCHVFWSRANDCSFLEHIDLDDVIIHCAAGSKHMTVNGVEVMINEGDHIHIPAFTKHQALNTTDSIMLSFGLERYSIDKAV